MRTNMFHLELEPSLVSAELGLLPGVMKVTSMLRLLDN